MDTIEALDFLRQHQPMPDDHDLTDEVIDKYNKVRQHFLEHPDPACIPLFLNSFGSGDGLGVYVMIEEVLMQFSPDEVIPHLLTALASPIQSVRMWSADNAANFPAPELIDPLTKLLQENDYDSSSMAIITLEQIEDERVTEILRQTLINEQDPDLREIIQDALSRRKPAN